MDLRIWIFLVIAGYVIATCSTKHASKVDGLALSCMTSYLKSKNLLERKFPTVPSPDDSETVCAKLNITEFQETFFNTLQEDFASEKETASDTECLVEKLRQSPVFDLTLKRHVYESAKGISRIKRKKAIKAVDSAIEKISGIASIMCTFNETFGSLFDEFCEESKDKSSKDDKEESSSEEDEGNESVNNYCVRKYLTENHFIDTSIYKVDLNPTNVNITDVNCDKIVKKAKHYGNEASKNELAETLGITAKRSKKCLAKKLCESNYYETFAKIEVLCEIKPTPERMAIERNDFINNLRKMFEKFVLC